MLVVSVGIGRKINSLNPGLFYSKGRGQSWTKANYQLGHPGRIMAARPDLRGEDVIWVALYGSDWFKGVITNVTVRAVANNMYLRPGERAQLDGRPSIGIGLAYGWSGPSGNPTLSSNTVAAPTFTAPAVPSGTEFKYKLAVAKSGSGTDTIEVRVVVRNYSSTAV
jgi:hypothetical protein